MVVLRMSTFINCNVRRNCRTKRRNVRYDVILNLAKWLKNLRIKSHAIFHYCLRAHRIQRCFTPTEYHHWHLKLQWMQNECVRVEASKSGDVHEINFVKLMHCLISFAKNGIKTFLIWPLICFSFSNVYHLTMPLHLAEKKLSWWFILPLSVCNVMRQRLY